MSKKYKRFYSVLKASGLAYIKMESDLIFSPEEGENEIRKNHPEATEIKLLNKKMSDFLNLK